VKNGETLYADAKPPIFIDLYKLYIIYQAGYKKHNKEVPYGE